MAAANKGSPIQLEGPFPEGAMGPLTQRPGQLNGALGQPPTTRAWLYPSSYLEVTIGRLFLSTTRAVYINS